MGSSINSDKRRTSIFIDEALLKQVKDYAGDHGSSMADVTRAALMIGLVRMRHGHRMFGLKNDVLEAAAAGNYILAREAIDRLAAAAGKPGKDQLIEEMTDAVDRRDFASARTTLNQLELYLGGRGDTSPGLEGMDEALEDHHFDTARNILSELEAKANSAAPRDGSADGLSSARPRSRQRDPNRQGTGAD